MNFARPINAFLLKRKKRIHVTEKKGSSFWKKILLIFSGVLCFILAFILFIPTLLSTEWARQKLVNMLQQSLPKGSTLHIKDWSLSWWSEQKVFNISYQLKTPIQTLSTTIEDLTIPSMWALLPIHHIDGKIKVENLIVRQEPIQPATTSHQEREVALAPIQAPKTELTQSSSLQSSFIDLSSWDITLTADIINTKILPMGESGPTITLPQTHLTLPSLVECATLKSQAILTFQQDGLTALQSNASLELITQPLQSLVNINLSQLNQPLLHRLSLLVDGDLGDLTLHATEIENSTYPKIDLEGQLNLTSLNPLMQTLSNDSTFSSTINGVADYTIHFTPQVDRPQATLNINLQAPTSITYNQENICANLSFQCDGNIHLKHLLDSHFAHLKIQLPGMSIIGSGDLSSGKLTASFDTNTFFSTYQTFLKSSPFKADTGILLSLSSEKNKLQSTLQLLANKNVISETELLVSNLQPTQMTYDFAELNHQTDIEALSKIIEIPFAYDRLKGDFKIRGKATPRKTANDITATFSLKNTDFRFPGWQIQAQQLINADCKATYENHRLSFENGLIETPILRFITTGMLDFNTKPITLSMKNEGVIQPTLLFSQWRQWGKRTPFNFDGQIRFSTETSMAENLQTLLTASTSDDFAYLQQGQPPLPAPCNLQTQFNVSSNKEIKLENLSLSSSYGNVNAQGTLDSNTNLNLSGSLMVNFEALSHLSLFESLNQNGITISGKHSRPFQLSTPLSMGSAGILNYGEGFVSLAFDRITIPGLDIPQGEIHVKLKDALAIGNGKVMINDGYIHLNPIVHLASSPYLLTWPKDAYILENFTLTQTLLNTSLKAINPIFVNAGTPEGSISIKANNIHCKLTDTFFKESLFDLTLSTHKVALTPNELLTSMLAYTKHKNEKLELPNQNIQIKIEDQILTSSPLSLRIDDYKIRCEGTTDLITQQVNYNLSMPLENSIFTKKIKNNEQTESLVLPIYGTISKPKIDLTNLITLLSESAKDKLSQEATKLIEKSTKKSKRVNKVLSEILDSGILEDAETPANTEDNHQKINKALDSLFKRRKK